MRGEADESGTQLHAAGWQQGSLFQADDLARLGLGEFSCAAVISQDCDIVQTECIEPKIEIVCGQQVETAQPDCLYGRNPRLLDLEASQNGEAKHLLFSIHDKVILEKHKLRAAKPSNELVLRREQVRILIQWISKRYSRTAWPDEFNRRLDQEKKKLEKLFKSKNSAVLTGIWVDLDPADDELSDADSYRLAIWLSVRDATLNDSNKYKMAQEFASEFENLLSDCNGLEVKEVEVRPESDISLEDLRLFKKLDRDYRSLAPKPGGEMSVE